MKTTIDRAELATKMSHLLEPVGFHLVACANAVTNVEGEKYSSVALIGNVASTFWPEFATSPEYLDGDSDPLDRYSKRIVDQIADEFEGALAVYPSDGPPYMPFQSWAVASGVYHQSPVAVLIHQQHGLWTAFRGAVLLPFEIADVAQPSASPCQSCVDKPCLTACPVGAFEPSASGVGFGAYDSEGCRQHVADQSRGSNHSNCYYGGCLARRACPVGRGLSYEQTHVKFHMNKFIAPLIDN